MCQRYENEVDVIAGQPSERHIDPLPLGLVFPGNNVCRTEVVELLSHVVQGWHHPTTFLFRARV